MRAEMRRSAETGPETRLVHAWIVNGGADGERFLSDIWRMLQLRAEEGGGFLNSITLPDRKATCPEYFGAATDSRTIESLVQELGVHRAQSVPVDSASGRVETSLVGVEIVDLAQTPSRVRPAGSVVRTYSYVTGRAIHHSSGRRYRLENLFGAHSSSEGPG